MKTLIPYIITMVVALGLFWSAYAVFLRKEPQFRFNRIYLLASLVLSLMLPLVLYIPSLFPGFHPVGAGNALMGVITLAPVTISAAAGKLPSLYTLAGYIYLAGCLFFTLRLLFRLAQILRIRSKGQRTMLNGIPVVWSPGDIPPFSFLNTVYLPGDLKDSEHFEAIFRHEFIHIRSGHSIDLMLIRLMQIVCWFNPFLPLTEASLREVHEFEADKAVLKSGTDPVAYTRILFSQNQAALEVVLGSNFNYSLIRRRLTMFYRTTSRFARLKAMAVIPTTVVLCLFVALSCRQNTEKTVLPAPPPAVPADSIAPPPPPPPPPPSGKFAFAEPVFSVVEKMPEFPGGDQGRIDYMMKEIQYPAQAAENGEQGTVYVSFVVEKDGSITDASVLKGIGKACDAEALRVVRHMPKWIPGRQDGKPVRVKFNMPIRFTLKG
jgi:TonB family protein